MTAFQISRREFKRLAYDKLETLAEKVVQFCGGNPEYLVIDAFVLELQNALPAYHDTLLESLDKSTTAILRKREARKTIEDILERIAKTLEVHATTEVFIADTGLKVNGKQPISQRDIPIPVSLTARSTGNPGEVLVRLQVEEPRLVKLNAVEFSPDEGLTWSNGTYKKRSKFVMNDLPALKRLLLRARSIGTDGRMSPWTQPVAVAVL